MNGWTPAAPPAAINSDPALASMGAVDRAADGGGPSPCLAERRQGRRVARTPRALKDPQRGRTPRTPSAHVGCGDPNDAA